MDKAATGMVLVSDDDVDEDGYPKGLVPSDPEEAIKERKALAANPDAMQFLEDIRAASQGQADRQRARFGTYLEGLFHRHILGMKLQVGTSSMWDKYHQMIPATTTIWACLAANGTRHDPVRFPYVSPLS